MTIPRNTSESLSSAGAKAGQLIQLQMPDLHVNQNACKNTTFHLTYTGEAYTPCGPGRDAVCRPGRSETPNRMRRVRESRLAIETCKHPKVGHMTHCSLSVAPAQ